jgi:hypothetical protein
MDKYVFNFSAFDLAPCEAVRKTMSKLKKSTYFKDRLYFHVTNDRWNICRRIRKIPSKELYFGEGYQALNKEEAYGYLRKVDVNKFNLDNLTPQDIVILNGQPYDMPVVAGIICTEFQSVLSHINVLSHNRRTPNMWLPEAWDSPEINALAGGLVYLKVEGNKYTMRKAVLSEAQVFWDNKEGRKAISLSKIDTLKSLVDTSTCLGIGVNQIGGKAANFFDLANIR